MYIYHKLRSVLQLSFRSLKESVDNLVRTSRGMSEQRTSLIDSDPFFWDTDSTWYDSALGSFGGYWPTMREGTPIRSTVRAR